MKTNCLLPFTVLLFISSFAFAQPTSIFLQSGVIKTEPNIRSGFIDSLNIRSARTRQKTFAVIQFNQLPGAEMRAQLKASGIELLDYIPDRAYTVLVSGSVNTSALRLAGARTLVELEPGQKMQTRLAKGELPAWADKGNGIANVWISFPRSFTVFEVITKVREMKLEVASMDWSNYRVLSLLVPRNRLAELASQPFVEYVQPAPQKDQELNYNSRYGSRANLLNASVADGGKGLDGQGVVVGVGDNADIQLHIDFAGRLINRAAEPITAGHGHHVAGTIAGAGNGNDMYRGYAPKATLIAQGFSGIILNAKTYVRDYGMTITNNSYGENIECSYFGNYDLSSRLLDQMAFDLPELTNVFSSGNSGLNTCSPFFPSSHTVLGGYQTAKNVITVGATTDSGQVSDFSSRGPVLDGRLKPEIVAMGQFVASAWSTTNNYGYNNGTSMSAPAVSGGLALLTQRFRQVNGGVNPKNDLLKALLCNGAADRGTVGPDYQAGFGWMNLVRSIDMIEQHHYFTGTSLPSQKISHSITIPAHTALLKVMLYWNDPAASVLSAKSLVNDLDLRVTSPASGIHAPLVLDSSKVGLSLPATNGDDHTNNVEQVVIDHPVAGTYQLEVNGFNISQNNSQNYVIVYDFIPEGIVVTAPAGGESLAPSTYALDLMKISWDAYGFSSGTATLEFSADNGVSWSTVAAGVDINRKVFTWWVPDTATSVARVRVSRDGGTETATSGAFTIVKRPVISLDAVQCEGYLKINWTSVPGATDYEVVMLKDGEMKRAALATGNTYQMSGLSKDSVYWVSVRARVNGKPGPRAEALSRQPNSGTCTGSVSDNDLKVDALLAPITGRKFTSSELSNAATVRVRVKNLDDVPVTGFDLSYTINGGPPVIEHLSSTIPALSTLNYNFITKADLSTPGTYRISVTVTNALPDPVRANDTLTATVKQLDNQPLSLAAPFLDNLETATEATYERNITGITGLDRYDFSRSTAYGRLRTAVNSGMAYSGNRALTLDVNRYLATGNTNVLVGTYNLSSVNAATRDIRLDFRFNSHGQFAHPSNGVWVRGSDTQPWIPAFDMSVSETAPGIYLKSSSIEVSDLLAAAGQSFTTSFQVRWGQLGVIAATDLQNAGGYSFDDIRLYEVNNDIQMIAVTDPVTSSCGLTQNNIVTVALRNSSNTAISSVPVRYRVNGGAWADEIIPVINANATLNYSFTTPANLSALGDYSIDAVVAYGGDSFRENDTAHATITNAPVITQFPYLQDFESGSAYWVAKGRNSSWAYGTPASRKIKSAASGTKAWKTNLYSNYNDNELSYLYSPCFDLTGMTRPSLSFSVAMDLEDCGSQLCDGVWLEYSADGINWTKLGTAGAGTNWYTSSVDNLWTVQDATRWHVATTDLPKNISRLRVRFVMASDPASNREGIAIDDIHIYDNSKGIYDGATMTGAVQQSASGNQWIDFTNGGKLIASVQPRNNNLGQVQVRAYINSNAVRHTTTQFYHDRNITIKPANKELTDSVMIRYYFLDTEMDTLVKATGCDVCLVPESAYEMGVSKYSDPDTAFENGSIEDNNQGIWQYIDRTQVKIVPFDKGYYAEFGVKNFSEFWLNNGGFTKVATLPVKLMDFQAKRMDADVYLTWKLGGEQDVDHYELELARGNAEVSAGHFTTIGNVAALGNTTSTRTYSFMDKESDKFGMRYYRMKVVNSNGSFIYSPIRSISFDPAVLWKVYPNPSTGLFFLVYQLNAGETLSARILDARGQLVKETSQKATGFVQKLTIDLTTQPAAVYMLEINGAEKVQSFRLFKR